MLCYIAVDLTSGGGIWSVYPLKVRDVNWLHFAIQC